MAKASRAPRNSPPEGVAPEAWAAYRKVFGADADPDRFDDRFEGRFDSAGAFGESFADRFGDIPDFLSPYVNWADFARDLEGVRIVERDGAAYVFDVNHA